MSSKYFWFSKLDFSLAICSEDQKNTDEAKKGSVYTRKLCSCLAMSSRCSHLSVLHFQGGPCVCGSQSSRGNISFEKWTGQFLPWSQLLRGFSSLVRYVSPPNRNTARPGWLEKVDRLIGIWINEIPFFYRSFTVLIHCSCTTIQRCRKFSIASHAKNIRSQSLLYSLYFEGIP